MSSSEERFVDPSFLITGSREVINVQTNINQSNKSDSIEEAKWTRFFVNLFVKI